MSKTGGKMNREEIYKKLTKPFDAKAYSADISRAKRTKNLKDVMTSIKAHYIVERLNEVFGLGNWVLDGSWNEVDDGVVFVGELKYKFVENDTAVECTVGPVAGFAGVDKANSGDAYKSARTDCLSKSASYIGIGNDVYKGEVDPILTEEQKEELGLNEKPEEKKEAKPASSTKKRFGKPASEEVEDDEDEEVDDEVEEDEEDSESDDEDSEDTPPPRPAKLKASRMFSRASKLNKAN